MATIHDETNDVSHTIKPNEPLIIGRGTAQFNLTHPNVSRKQVEINLLDNGSCFVKRLAVNPTLLNGKALPKDSEIQVYNGDIIELIPNTLPYKFCLPGKMNQCLELDDVVIPPTAPTAMPGEKYYYDENNMDEYQTQQPSMGRYSIEGDEYYSPGHELTSDEDEPVGDGNSDHGSDGWVSSESSLLGGERWTDDDDDGDYKQVGNKVQKK
ncbi:hypothetical protein BDC45DRAFT_569538 [Circinella umbellata]|nr:hypothetical protein BDC45DRAFT_569538 [Circinella umbellata]